MLAVEIHREQANQLIRFLILGFGVGVKDGSTH